MDFVYQIQMVVSLLASLIIAGAWWYAALRLSSHWVLFALAIVASISALLALAFLLLMQTPATNTILPAVSHMHILVNIADSVLYIIFAGWLVRQCGGTPPPPPLPTA